MLVTLSGITGTGKSYYKNILSSELGFENLVIVTTRAKRESEKEGIDKIFVNEEQFEKMKKDGEFLIDFDMLGIKYAYKKDDIKSNQIQVTELHYSTIYEFRKKIKNLLAIYIIPNSVERAKQELHKRNLPKDVEEDRIREINEHIKEFENNDELKKQFDYIFINDYTEESKKKLIEIIKLKLLFI